MVNLGIVYPFLDAGVIDNLNKIIEDYQQKAMALLKKDYIVAQRDILPTDSIIGGASPDNWSTLAAASATTKVNAITAATRVDTDQAVLILGWYANRNLGADSRFFLQVNDKTRAPIPAEAVFNAPGHFLLTPKLLVFLKNNDRINFNIANALAVPVDGIFFPLGIVYGEAGVLGVD
jgi:hypothetical protein